LKTISILGSGWLGLPLANSLSALGYSVSASTTSPSRLNELKSIGAKAFLIDTTKKAQDFTAFLDSSILVINIPSKDVSGFHNLGKAISASSVTHVLFVSSTSVYKDINMRLTELDCDVYSDSPLLVIEDILMKLPAIKTTVLRFGGLVGEGRHPGDFFKAGRPIANPDSPVNLIHRDDCIEIIHQIIEQQAWGEIFNACADEHPSKQDFYTQATKALGYPPPNFGPSNEQTGKLICNEKLKKFLNYRFKYPNIIIF